MLQIFLLKRANIDPVLAEVGTDADTLVITNHGMQTGEMILNTSRNSLGNPASRAVTAVDTDTLELNKSIDNQALGDSLFLFKYVDITSMLKSDTFNLSRTIQKSTCNFSLVIDNPSNVPIEGQQILIKHNNIVIFGGSIYDVRLRISGIPNDGHKIIASISSNGYNHMPARRSITVDYPIPMTSGQIVTDMVNNYLSSEGITEGIIQDGADWNEYPSDFPDKCISVKQVLDDMANKSGYKWYIDINRQLHFIQNDTVVDATHVIADTDSAGDGHSIPAYEYVTDSIPNYNSNIYPYWVRFRVESGDEYFIVSKMVDTWYRYYDNTRHYLYFNRLSVLGEQTGNEISVYMYNTTTQKWVNTVTWDDDDVTMLVGDLLLDPDPVSTVTANYIIYHRGNWPEVYPEAVVGIFYDPESSGTGDSGDNITFWNVEITQSLEDYRNKQFVKGGWDYYYGDAMVNFMENVDGIVNRQLSEGGSGVYGAIYVDDSEDTNVTEMTAEAGTTSTNVNITGHGLKYGDMVMNLTNRKKRVVSAVIDANNFLIGEEILLQAPGDIVAVYPDANAICRNNLNKYGLVAPKTITFETTALDFVPGTKLTVNLQAFGMTTNEYYLIESVTLRDEDGINLLASVSATQRDATEFNTQQSESWVDTFAKLGGSDSGKQLVEMTTDQADSLAYFTPGKYIDKKDDTLPVMLPDLVGGVSTLGDVITKVNALIQALTDRQHLSDGTPTTGLKRVDLYKYS